MVESRCLGNARTNRKGKVQVYINEDMYDAVAELQAKKDATKMLKYIENLTKHNSSFIQDCFKKIFPEYNELPEGHRLLQLQKLLEDGTNRY